MDKRSIAFRRCRELTEEDSGGMMNDGAVAVRTLKPYLLEVTLRGGRTRLIDMASYLSGDVFEPLRDPALFAQAAVDPVFGSVFWPTGADLSPEFVVYGEGGPPYGYDDEPIDATDADPLAAPAR